MKIQKATVGYKGRDDIQCLYGVSDAGVNYYFLDETGEKRFSNVNRIATKNLKEAIDPMVPAKEFGIIDENGNEVIPFTNKSIKPINDSILVVEPANPVSPSVVEALSKNKELSNDSNDAINATGGIVSTAAQIKERLNEKVGQTGRFLFNDQVSEATLYDIYGNNLLGNEYYSYIVSTGDKLYFSKNTPDSEIVEYSLLPAEVQANVETQDINVGDVQVSQDVVENALTAEASAASADENKETATEEAYQAVVPSGMEAQAEEEEENAQTVIPIAPPIEREASATMEKTETTTPPPENIIMDNNDAAVEQKSVGFAPEDITGDLMGAALPTVVAEEVANEEKAPEMTVVPPEGTVPSEEVAVQETSGELDNTEVKAEEGNDLEAAYLPPVVEAASEENESAAEEVANEEKAPEMTVVPPEGTMANAEGTVPPEEVAAQETSGELDNTEVKAEEKNTLEAAYLPPVVEAASEETGAAEEVANEETSSEMTVVPPEEVVAQEISGELDNTEEKAEEGNSLDAEETGTVADEVVNEETAPEMAVVPQVEVPAEVVEAPVPEETVPAAEVPEPEEVPAEDTFETSFEDTIPEDSFEETNMEEEVPMEDSLSEEDTELDSEYDTNDSFDLDEEDDVFKDSIVHTDKIEYEDEYVPSFDRDLSRTKPTPSKGNFIVDVAQSMSGLMKQNKEQKALISEYEGIIHNYEEDLKKLNASRKNIVNRAKAQEQKLDVLASQVQSYKAANAKLESKNEILENRVKDQERVISSQMNEINHLRSQTQGTEELAQLLAAANDLLEEDNSYDHDDVSHYRRVA